jgi:hypothetical protein
MSFGSTHRASLVPLSILALLLFAQSFITLRNDSA